MESQVLGFHVSSHSKAACAALAALMLSAPVSLAAGSHHRTSVVPYGSVHASSWAQYEAAFPNTIDRSNECIGGYRYMRHTFDWNRTAAQDEVPLPCR
jgi:hypothetical protein